MVRGVVNGAGQGLHGDLTTTGAVCISSLPQATQGGSGVLRLGDVTTPCPKCGSPGEIVEGFAAMKWHGIPTALDGAIIHCGCPAGTHRLIAPRGQTQSSQPSRQSAQAVSTSEPPVESILNSDAAPPLPNADIAIAVKAAFGRTFIISHSETRSPLANRTFIATVDGFETIGVTDSDGLAHVQAPLVGSAITIHIPFQSPARVLQELTERPMANNSFKTSAEAREIKPGQPPVPITINDRAATREALIRQIRFLGHEFVERSEWKAHVPKKPLEEDWGYTMIALHNAGRSHSCGIGAEQMLDIQEEQQDKNPKKRFDDIGYHFGIDCSGIIYEGRDIRFKGSSILEYNTRVIGVVLLNNLTAPEEGTDWVTRARKTLSFIGMDTTNHIPDLQIDAALNLTNALKRTFVIKHLGGHREYPGQKTGEAKICPGHMGMSLVKNIRTKTRLLPPPKS